MTCDSCGGPDGEECIDPYAQDVNGIEIEMVLCSRCYSEKVADI